MQGNFPYFGAAKVFDYLNDYIFDGEYLLMAEDGSVITPEQTPVLQLATGKFWANNHTHVIRGTEVSTHFIYLALSTFNVSGYITGAAQPKITQANMNRMPFVCGPPELHALFDRHVDPIVRMWQRLECRNQTLRQTRDLLLPKLLSGQMALPVSETVTVEPSTPARASRPAKSTPIQENPVPRPTSSTPETPPSIDDIARKDVLCAIRKLFSDGWWRDRETALKELSQALGYRRLGPHIREVLSTDLLTAVRRGILTSEGGEYTLGFRSLTDLPRDVLKDRFLSAIGRSWITRDDAIRAFARSLGFARTGDQIDQTARSLINGLIREGRLESDGGEMVRRR